ncbi:MAG: HNH endonuclease [Methanomethylophilus sp.]
MLHGIVCQICSFDFSKAYGERDRRFIKVHHRKSVSTFGGELKIDSDADLVCVCSNCHRMIYRYEPVLSVGEMKEIVRKQRVKGIGEPSDMAE